MENLPEEIQDQIVQNIPVQDLPKVMLVSRSFYRQARPYLYKSVHYFDNPPKSRNYLVGGIPLQPNFALLPNNTRAYDPTYSARIVRLAHFLRTIMETQLSSHITEASFSTTLVESGDHEAEDDNVWAAENKCLNTLSLITSKLVLTHSITSLDIMETFQAGQNARNQMYSIFSIKSLRHLCLRYARCWHIFSPIPDDTRIGTSNLISLSLLDTVPIDTDLQEILTWPKGLKYFHHGSETDQENWFSRGFTSTRASSRASPQLLLEGIASQRETLEELSYDNVEDRCGADGTTFDAKLLSEFSKLTHMTVHRNCLITNNYATGRVNFVYIVLPPNLLELHLFEDEYIHGDLSYGEVHVTEYVRRVWRWLEEIAYHRDKNLPALKTVITWEAEFDWPLDNYRAAAQPILDQM